MSIPARSRSVIFGIGTLLEGLKTLRNNGRSDAPRIFDLHDRIFTAADSDSDKEIILGLINQAFARNGFVSSELKGGEELPPEALYAHVSLNENGNMRLTTNHFATLHEKYPAIFASLYQASLRIEQTTARQSHK